MDQVQPAVQKRFRQFIPIRFRRGFDPSHPHAGDTGHAEPKHDKKQTPGGSLPSPADPAVHHDLPQSEGNQEDNTTGRITIQPHIPADRCHMGRDCPISRNRGSGGEKAEIFGMRSSGKTKSKIPKNTAQQNTPQ